MSEDRFEAQLRDALHARARAIEAAPDAWARTAARFEAPRRRGAAFEGVTHGGWLRRALAPTVALGLVLALVAGLVVLRSGSGDDRPDDAAVALGVTSPVAYVLDPLPAGYTIEATDALDATAPFDLGGAAVLSDLVCTSPEGACAVEGTVVQPLTLAASDAFPDWTAVSVVTVFGDAVLPRDLVSDARNVAVRSRTASFGIAGGQSSTAAMLTWEERPAVRVAITVVGPEGVAPDLADAEPVLTDLADALVARPFAPAPDLPVVVGRVGEYTVTGQRRRADSSDPADEVVCVRARGPRGTAPATCTSPGELAVMFDGHPGSGPHLVYGVAPEDVTTVAVTVGGEAHEVEAFGVDADLGASFFAYAYEGEPILEAEVAAGGRSARVTGDVTDPGSAVGTTSLVPVGEPIVVAEGADDTGQWRLVAGAAEDGFCFGLGYGEPAPGICHPDSNLDAVGGAAYAVGVSPSVAAGVITRTDVGSAVFVLDDGREIDADLRTLAPPFRPGTVAVATLPDGAEVAELVFFDAAGVELHRAAGATGSF